MNEIDNSNKYVELVKTEEHLREWYEEVQKNIANIVNSNAVKSLQNFFDSFPNDIRETDYYKQIKDLEAAEISYLDIVNLQNELGNQPLIDSISKLDKKCNKTELDRYIISIVESKNMSSREKIVIVLAHFEELFYQAIGYDRKKNEKIKNIVRQRIDDDNSSQMNNMNLCLLSLAGIVFIVFSNTDKYVNEIDRSIPFRNNILHRGLMSYSSEEIENVYELLVYFIAEISMIETRLRASERMPRSD